MSDEGEKTCPLCAEEMDFTDQQLKPCKCGYEICVWCWHHIMDMAEKDHTEGRCPACRTAYNKEKIVGTGPNSESGVNRLVSDINAEKRHKSHKGKSKASEGRKQLGNVRVIQKNLVYVVGLPLTFADEELLHRRDHFGQYGKVLKVSISRTASGAIQQFPNSTCSVYITYSKEEDAVRCIQSVHGFVLDSRPLKACFGTTKYCRAWLRSMPCANPDCLYLHEVGSQEDSFTKDEIVSAYTRVQQITGTSNSIQRRSGNFLPPPADEYCNDVSTPSAKPVIKTATITKQNSAASVSPPNSSSGRSVALPAGASWGARSSTSQTMPTSTPCSIAPVKPKPDSSNGPVAVSTAVASPSQSPLRSNIGKKSFHNEVATTIPQDKSEVKDPEPTKEQSNTNKQTIAVHGSSEPPTHSETSPVNKKPSGPLSSKLPSNSCHIVNTSATSLESALDKSSDDVRDVGLENICSSILSMSVHENQQMQSSYTEQITGKPDPLTSVEAENTTINTMPTPQKPLDLHEVEDDLLSFDNQRANDPEIAINRMHDFSNMFHLSNHPHPPPSFMDPVSLANGDLNRQVVDRDNSFMVSGPNLGHSENMFNRIGIDNGGYSNIFLSDEKGLTVRGYDDFSSETVNMGENSIIADILSMDDPWDDCLTSPTNLARMFPKSDTHGSYGAPGPRKTQYSDQSKFSFAREQEGMSHVSDFRQPVDYLEQAYKQQPAGHDFSSSNGLHLEKSITRNGFPFSNSTESDIYANNHLSMNKNAALRSQILPPPGFSGPSRPPPPGFTSQGRIEQNLDVPPANHMFDASSLSRYQYSAASSNNTYTKGDIEFMDPAILAVGKETLASGAHNPRIVDIMSSFTPQSSTYEEARFQSLLQRSLPPHQNQRFADAGFADAGDRFSNLVDAYGLPNRVVDHALANNHSPFSQFTQSMNGMNSNGQWDNWNEMPGGNNLGMAELLRNERLGYNNLYGGYEDSKIRMSSSGNLYNGAYGI